jgi:hypothetical protein
MENEEYQSIRKGDAFLVTRNSPMNGTGVVKLIANGKPRSLSNGKQHRVSLNNAGNPNGCKYWLYYRDGKLSLAHGDMGVSIISITKQTEQ